MSGFIASDGPIRIVVATIAFGMGLDAPNIRTVIHWDPAMSIEAYLQETGQVSRDGLKATAVLYVSRGVGRGGFLLPRNPPPFFSCLPGCKTRGL